jgi:hypothetical protein
MLLAGKPARGQKRGHFINFSRRNVRFRSPAHHQAAFCTDSREAIAHDGFVVDTHLSSTADQKTELEKSARGHHLLPERARAEWRIGHLERDDHVHPGAMVTRGRGHQGLLGASLHVYRSAYIFAWYIDGYEECAMRPPLPPFDATSAAQKARAAEDAWNTRDPARVAQAYTEDSVWRNRAEFLRGRTEIVAFLTRKWRRELDYRLIKEVWAYAGDRIAVRFAYEWHDDSGFWYRSYGNENWEFDGNGLMRVRRASINDLPIAEVDRKFRWPLGPRPPEHPGLTALDL